MGRTIFTFLSGFALLAASLAWIMVSMPDPKEIKGCMTTEMFKVQLCEKSKNYVGASQISKYLKDVVVISEDASFYHHNGFDWFEIQNSVKENLHNLSYSRGGSTITQQLAKNVFLSSNKTLTRKLREAYLTFQLENILTKPKILEKYLNVVEFGKDMYGVKAAASYYFSKAPANLNLLESAFLAYLLPNPKLYSRVYKKGALTAFSRFRILDLCYKMYRYGRISEDQYRAAKDYVSLFPWKGLDGAQIDRLNGAGGEVQPTEEIPQLAIPESDVKEAPPVASQQIIEEMNNMSEDQPFDEPETVNPAEIEHAGAADAPATPPLPAEPPGENETFDN